MDLDKTIDLIKVELPKAIAKAGATHDLLDIISIMAETKRQLMNLDPGQSWPHDLLQRLDQTQNIVLAIHKERYP